MKAQKLWRSSQLIAGILSVGALAACGSAGGTSHGPGGMDTPGGAGANGSMAGAGAVVPGGGGPTSGGGDTGVAGMVSIPSTPVPESAGTMVMRRLTYREYDHMIAQLLGDNSSPASAGDNSWSPDTPTIGTNFVSPSDVQAYHVTQYFQVADALVNKALANLAAGKTGKFTIPCAATPAAAEETTCATTFITTFGKQAYRRPISADEQKDLLTLFTTVRTTDKLSFTDSIGAIAKAMLQSPNFLYHWEIGPTKPAVGADGLVPLTQWQVASRLASSLWESMPDDTLLTAAQNNELSTPAQVSAQATRMLGDLQTNQALYNFHLQWFFNMGFHVTDLATIPAKGTSGLTAAAALGLQNEFTQFISSVYSAPGDGTLNTLYTAPYAFVNKDLAAIYGVAGPATGFAKVQLDPTQRAGIFTQVAFLAGIQESLTDNPVYRGLAVYTKALCGAMGKPPDLVPTVNFMSAATTRLAYDMHAASPCAKACHQVFDPAGFAFENYDGIGKYRTMEGTTPVDSTGTFSAPAGSGATPTVFKFNNAVELAKQLAASPEAQTCIDRQWTRFMLGRMETMAEQGSLTAAYNKGAATPGFSVRDMLVTLLSSKAFMYRQPSAGEPI